MKVFTIGFTKKNAERFFTQIRKAGISRIVDIRLNNTSQLAGFTKKDDLKFFLREICNIDYVHMPELAPTKEILDAYKKKGGDWNAYEHHYTELLKTRRIEKTLSRNLIDGGCFLCSEATPEQCHRRLAAEYLRDRWGDIEIHHL